MKNKKINISKLIASILICEAAGVAGSIFTTPKISTWYASLNKPSFNPPSWIFGPVWTALFLLMGIALYFVWEAAAKNKKAKEAAAIFGIQLALNILWSYLFFGLQNPFYALIEIFVLWLAILAAIIAFNKIDKKAAYLLLPYILWVSFAAFLNFSLWKMNL